MKQRSQALWLCLCFVLAVTCGSVIGADDLATKCGQVVQKVLPCLNFATGKAATPSKECCDASESIKESSPECLCYIIQQTHKGSPESKSLGIQEAKLLQLPSACNLKNASVSNCPKILGLPANSPDAAIFKNSSSSATTPAAAESTTNSSSTPSPNGSFGSILKPHYLFADIMAVASTLLLVAFPSSVFISNFT